MHVKWNRTPREISGSKRYFRVQDAGAETHLREEQAGEHEKSSCAIISDPEVHLEIECLESQTMSTLLFFSVGTVL